MEFYAVYSDPRPLVRGDSGGRPVAYSFLGEFFAPSDAAPAMEACKARKIADDADSLQRWIGVHGTEEAARAAWLDRIGRPLGFESFHMLEKQEYEWRTQVTRIKVEGVDRYFTKYSTTADPVTHDQLLALINEAE